MPSNVELYVYYCRRSACKPNSSVKKALEAAEGTPLEVLDVSQNYLGQRGLLPVLDLVKNTKTIHTLDMSNQEMGVEQVQHLAYCLALHPCIRTLRVRRDGLHDAHAKVLLQLLAQNTVIEEVDVSNNDVSAAARAALQEALLRNQAIQRSRHAEDAAHAKLRASRICAAPPRCFTASVHDRVAATESGGYIHYATWWKNPQFSVKLSRPSTVSFVLECAQADLAANQMGFVVMCHDGVHRAVELTETSLVAESPIHEMRCALQIPLDPTESNFVVMPFSFNPGRAFAFTLTASLVNDRADQEEGWITLERIEERYDWCTHLIQSGWIAETAGGAGGPRSTTWRRNAMYHLTATAAEAAGASPVTVYVLLSKESDPYDADERAIGLDVVRHDPRHAKAPPLSCTGDVVCAAVPHEQKNFVLLKVELPLAQLDVYVVPSTLIPGQTGPYSLTIFASVAVALTPSQFPHGWRYRTLEGQWDASCCGGCCDACPSWKYNPSIEVTAEEAAQTLVACVALRASSAVVVVGNGEGNTEVAAAAAAHGETAAEASETAAEGCLNKNGTEETPEAAQRKATLAAFHQRHRNAVREVALMAVQPRPLPFYPLLASSPLVEQTASVVVVPSLDATLYLVPMLRHPADVGAYTLEVFSPQPFLLADAVVPLAARERQAQLAAYAEESAQRAAAAREADARGGTRSNDTAALRAMRKDILERNTPKLPFVDRDFPRGASSLFLDPATAVLPLDFPVETVWRRASELTEKPEVRMSGVDATGFSPPHPYSPRHWFASVLHAVSAKPGWLSRVFVEYAAEAGFAQFVFYKQDAWVGVTVDDFLLVDSQKALVFGHSADPADVSFALAEKAYAKLHRCYEALNLQVCPALSLPEVLAQGLTDVTGGFVAVTRLRPSPSGPELSAAEPDVLWRQLKRGVNVAVLCALLLESGGRATREKSHVGILPDRLYGVMDVRFVEQQRLVKIRNFDPGRDADMVWRGKWRDDSPLWTDTLRAVLRSDSNATDPYAVWVHFDEVLHYFTHLYVTEVCPRTTTVPGSFAQLLPQVADATDAAMRNPQFSLQITPDASPSAHGAENSVARDAPTELHIGLHRRDPRLDVTRTKNVTAQLETAVGVAVFAVEDNSRRLCRVTEAQVQGLVKPNVRRDSYVTLHLTEATLRTQKFVVMPFRDGVHDPDVSYTLSVRCPSSAPQGVTARLCAIAADVCTSVEGAWETTKAAPPESPLWRSNPQLLLSVADAAEVTLTVRPRSSTTAKLGFTLHTTRQCRSFLNFDAATMVARAASETAGAAVSGVVWLAGMAERRGMPYVLVPHCAESGSDITGLEFSVEVLSNHPAQLRRIEPRLDWHRVRCTVTLSAAAGNTGGSPAYPSWRFNTQLAVTLPVERDGRLFIAARRLRSADPRVKVGMLLLRAGSSTDGSHRRVLTFDPDRDVVATAAVQSAGEATLDVEVSLPRDRGALVLVVYADQPYKEAEVEVAFFSAPRIEVRPVREWAAVKWEEGSWDLGSTAAGSRANFASWINNPFYSVSVLRPTTVTLLLVQYPRAHEHPAVRRHGQQKALLPPPLEHPDRCTSIQLSVAKYDADLTEVASTAPTTCAETHLTLELKPNQPCLVVPCTTEPQHDGDFKLFAFADHPIDLYETEKPRLPYV